MSIMFVQLTPVGILIGADRNITHQATWTDGSQTIVVSGQSQRPKVLKWPNRELIVGYVGLAQIGNQATDQWLYSFIGKHLTFSGLQELALKLTSDLNTEVPTGGLDPQPLVLHLAGFEKEADEWRPQIYFIRNTSALTPDGIYVVGSQFECSDEIRDRRYFGNTSGDEIKDRVKNVFFSFRQGYDLGAFNTIDAALRSAMSTIVQAHPAKPHPVPTTLEELAQHVAFAIRGYGAYFAAFYPPFEQYVGGGADVVSAAWPDN